MTIRKIFALSILAASVTLLGCKEGDPGPGFTNEIKYGNITATFSGKRPTDNTSFKVTNDFRFLNTGNTLNGYSSIYVDPDTKTKSISVFRYFSAVNEHINYDYFRFNIDVSSTGELTYKYFYVMTTLFDGTKYFGINETFYSNDSPVGDGVEIKDFKYDETTGKVTFTYVWTIEASGSTENPLTTEGKVDVTVLEALNNIGGNEG